MTEQIIKKEGLARISFKLPHDLKCQFRKMAFHTGQSMTDILTACIFDKLAEWKNKEEG